MAQDRVREGVSGTPQVRGVAYGPDLGHLLLLCPCSWQMPHLRLGGGVVLPVAPHYTRQSA